MVQPWALTRVAAQSGTGTLMCVAQMPSFIQGYAGASHQHIWGLEQTHWSPTPSSFIYS